MARPVGFGAESKKSKPNPWAGFDQAYRAAKKALGKRKGGGKGRGGKGGGS